MQLFRERHSFGEVDVQGLRHKSIPAAMWFQTAMGLQRASPREAFGCNRPS